MIKTQTKNLIIFFAIIGFVCSVSSPSIAQINPSWSNEEPSHNEPPNGGAFIRQDPLPKSLQDITVFRSDNKGVSLNIEFPDSFDYEIYYGPDGKAYRRYKADNRYKVIAEPGQPEILSRLIQIQVPRDAKNFEIKNTKAALKDTSEKNINIYPLPNKVFEHDKNQGYAIEKEEFYKDKELYNKYDWNPKEYAEIISDEYKHGMHQLQIAVPIMAYNPAAKQIQEFKAISFEVSYESSLAANQIIIDQKNDPFHKIFIDTIANYAHKKPYEQISNEGDIVEVRGSDLVNQGYDYYPNYLVIAAKTFDENEQAHQQLMNWAVHRSGEQGGNHKIAIAYVDEIANAYPGSDLLEEKIKTFIQMVYDYWRITTTSPTLSYLLLVGDADYGNNNKDWFLPTWRSNEPQGLEGTTGDNDYAWLEDESNESYKNDVLIGRLPAQDAQQLSTMITKIIDFETITPEGENHYGTRSLWLGGNKFDSLGSPENLVREMLVDGGEKGTLPAYELGEFDYNYEKGISSFQYDSDDVTNFLNNNGALFVTYNGHGDPAPIYPEWTGWYPSVNKANLENHDKMPLIVMSQACSTARFDFSDPREGSLYEPFPSHGEEWIKMEGKGAICFWGATRLAGGGLWADHHTFFQSVVENGNCIIGIALDETHDDSHSPDDRKRLVFLGDPAINFENHFKPSTKPDLRTTWVLAGSYYDPEFAGQEISIKARFNNNSSENFDKIEYALFSVKEGVLDSLLSAPAPTISMPAHSNSNQENPWIYNVESSMHFMYWIDPLNKIPERSEFNNHINSSRKIFPVYVDQNYTGQQEGSEDHPYRQLPEALWHVQEYDQIGENHRSKSDNTLKIKIQKGAYGDGNQLDCAKSISILGLEGADKTIIYDSLELKGNKIRIYDVTFNGKKLSGPSLIRSNPNRDGNTDLSGYQDALIRTVFKKSSDYAIHMSIYLYLYNCLFYKNHGVARLLPVDNQIKLASNFTTAYKNEHNIKVDNWNTDLIIPRIIDINGSIFWENGPSILPEEFTPDDLKITADYSDIDDYILLEGLDPEEPNEGNIEEDPKFFHPGTYNLHLRADSPCIDAGTPITGPNVVFDPDGTFADMGAYGGPEANIRQIRITKPVYGETIYVDQPIPFDVDVRIEWSTYGLSPDDLMNISVYHMEYEPINPDSGGTTTYNALKVIDLDKVVANSGNVIETITQSVENQSYFLRIESQKNPELGETINFKIMSENSSLYSNR